MLYGENFAPEPGPLRTADAQERRRFEEEFKRNFDPTIGRQLTPREKAARAAADYWLDKHKQEEAREAADKARRLAAQKAREAAERQQEERRQKRAQFEFKETQIDSMLDTHGATPEERTAVSQAIVTSGRDINDPQNHWHELMKLRSQRTE